MVLFTCTHSHDMPSEMAKNKQATFIGLQLLTSIIIIFSQASFRLTVV